MRRVVVKRVAVLGIPVVMLVGAWVGAAEYYRLSVVELTPLLSRAVLTYPARIWRKEDLSFVDNTRRSYWHGEMHGERIDNPDEVWRSFARDSEHLSLNRYTGSSLPPVDLPFIYESTQAPQLVELRANVKSGVQRLNQAAT